MDYGCPEESGKWTSENFPGVSVVYVTDDPGFNVSRARNFGAEKATSEYLIFIDADVKMQSAALDRLDNVIDENVFVTIETTSNDLRGTCMVHRGVMLLMQLIVAGGQGSGPN